MRVQIKYYSMSKIWAALQCNLQFQKEKLYVIIISSYMSKACWFAYSVDWSQLTGPNTHGFVQRQPLDKLSI